MAYPSGTPTFENIDEWSSYGSDPEQVVDSQLYGQVQNLLSAKRMLDTYGQPTGFENIWASGGGHGIDNPSNFGYNDFGYLNQTYGNQGDLYGGFGTSAQGEYANPYLTYSVRSDLPHVGRGGSFYQTTADQMYDYFSKIPGALDDPQVQSYLNALAQAGGSATSAQQDYISSKQKRGQITSALGILGTLGLAGGMAAFGAGGAAGGAAGAGAAGGAGSTPALGAGAEGALGTGLVAPAGTSFGGGLTGTAIGASGPVASAVGSGLGLTAGSGAAGIGAMGGAQGLVAPAGTVFGGGAIPGAVSAAGPVGGSAAANFGPSLSSFPGASAAVPSLGAGTGGVPTTGLGGGGNIGQGFQLSPSTSQQLGLPAQSATGAAPVAPTGGMPPSAGTSAPINSGLGSTVDGILETLKKNALQIGMSAIGLGLSAFADNKQEEGGPPAAQTLGAAGTTAANTAQQLIAQAQAGQLTAGQQAGLDRYANEAKQQIRQYFSSIRQFDSTARIQAEALVDQQAVELKQQILDQTLQAGINALGGATPALQSAAQYQVGQDRNLMAALGNFAQGLGQIFGQQGGQQARP